ncbi:hypothetical protein NF212_21730 [Parasalinivibrio latis]|uniref:excisionase n=1 Tax=Parasalinivibrio latis TaxID=2952610 RepID=UPI0030E17CA5
MNDYQFIRLSDWAAAVFPGEHYSPATISRWAKTHQIHPSPVKVGGRWMVLRSARFVGLALHAAYHSGDPLVERILRHGS